MIDLLQGDALIVSTDRLFPGRGYATLTLTERNLVREEAKHWYAQATMFHARVAYDNARMAGWRPEWLL